MRVRFMLLSIEDANTLPRPFSRVGRIIARIFPLLEVSLKHSRLNVNPENYAAAALISGVGYGILATFLVTILGFFSTKDFVGALPFGVTTGFGFFLMALIIHLIYPSILARKSAAGVDEGLLFALRSLQIQINSGVGLYDAMANVARSNYGVISKEFETVVQEISGGMNEATALERLALRTDSEFLRKTVWQLVTNIRSGSPLGVALTSIMNTLTEYQSRAIKSYAAELNMWILGYLLIAAALPTIGITFMVILSSIGGNEISRETIFLTVGMTFVIQVVLIGLIGSRAPRGYG